MQQIIRIAIVIILTGFFFQGVGSISVAPIVLDKTTNTTDKRMSLDINVANLSNEKAYVAVTPKIILYPGTKEKKTVVITDPKKYGLFVTPRKLILGPKARRLIRVSVLLKTPLQEDKIFSIDVQPKVAPVEFKEDSKKNVGMRVLVGYSVLAILRPPHPKPQIVLQRKGKTLLIRNLGNTSVLLSSTEQCNQKGKCLPFKNVKRVYAGNRWELTLPMDAPVTFLQIYMQDKTHISSK